MQRHNTIATLLLAVLAATQPLHAQEDVIPNAATPAIPGVLAGGLPLELVARGFDGSEGPLGLPDGSLLFTETRANRIIKVHADKHHEVWLENTNGANGLALNAAGELVAVQVGSPRVGVIAPADKARTLADNYSARAFIRPNDLVADRVGGVYFTDSGNNPAARDAAGNAPAPAEQASTVGIYYLDKAGRLTQLDDTIARPNGILLSPYEETLYVANTAGQHILAYPVRSPGKLGRPQQFAALAGWREAEGAWSSGADGLAVDAIGNLYVASNAGVEVFAADGRALGVIPLPVKPQNLAFAGADRDWLYVVGRGAVYRLRTLVPGYAGRAK